MGSVGNQNPWAPYNNYGSADCSQGVCSIYCPQFCYFFFPPPPPESNDDSTPFSPLIIAVIGVLASAFLLVGYYTLVTRYCNRRRQQNHNNNSNSVTINHSADHHTQCRAGLDESVIRAIAVRAYRKGDGLSECAVCLSEFREKEPIRVLPKCNHAFHPPCIDTWLLSQSTCPLCRAAVDIGYPYHPHEVVGQRAADLVLEVEDDDDHDGTILLGINDGHEEEEEEGIVVIKGLGRSVSLRIDVEGKGQRWRGIIGTSEEEEDCGGVRRMMMKRSVSTGGLSLTVDDGRGCLLPLPNS